MTMYEDLIKETNNKMLIDDIFRVMNYDKTFPSPSKVRRSGKTTYQIILALNEFLFNDDIKHIRFNFTFCYTKSTHPIAPSICSIIVIS